MRVLFLAIFLFATKICAASAAEKTGAEMSADADGWIFTGVVVIVCLASAAFISTYVLSKKNNSDKP